MKVVFIHGFSALEEDNIYFLDYLKSKNVDVSFIRLKGMSDTKVLSLSYKVWLNEAEKDFKKIVGYSRKVILIGHSMGGAIASILASRYPDNVKKLVLISPAFDVGSSIQNKSDFLNFFENRKNDKIKTGFEGILKKTLLVPFRDIFEVRKMGNVAKSSIDSIECPTLILHGTLDQVIDVTSSIKIYAKLKCKKHLTLLIDVRHQVFKSFKKDVISKYIYGDIRGGIIWKLKRQNQI